MTNNHHTEIQDAHRIAERSFFADAWKMTAGLAVVGAIGILLGYRSSPERFAFSYMFAFWVMLTLALGSLFFVLIQHVTGAAWSVTVRRISELVSSALITMGLLFIPILFHLKALFPWMATSHGGGHGAGHAAAMTPDEAMHHEIIGAKTGYLNVKFFVIRALLYFAVWGALSVFFLRKSVQQDESKAIGHSAKMEKLSPLSLFLLGFTVTFAAFDWIMSLEPSWYSTIYGVLLFASSMVAALALNIFLSLTLQKHGVLSRSIGVDHFHDLGKLLFGFIVFWAYVAFSQLLLIWYASIPEETTYYHLRWESSSWKAYSMFILFGHFLVPFLFLLSRNVKRNLPLLKLGAGWMLFMHVVYIYWLVMPYYRPGGEARLQIGMMDVACLLFVVGAGWTWILLQMKKVSLLPSGDPRLQRSLEFHGA